jgi:hypothetical protein
MPEAVTMTKGALKAPEMKYTAAIGRALGTGSGAISKPISGVKGELFGKDAFNNPKAGTKFLGKRFGSIMGGLTGGTFDNENNKYGVGVGKFRIPHPLGNIVPGTKKRAKNWVGGDSKAQKQYNAEQARKNAEEDKAKAEAEARIASGPPKPEDTDVPEPKVGEDTTETGKADDSTSPDTGPKAPDT